MGSCFFRNSIINYDQFINEAAMIYECIICGHEYDEEEEGVLFKDLPDDWECPDCGVKKDSFEAID